ncbi:hypothetical protein [Streptomyces sp. AK08-02]|uniref:hypothetical protein n=1 Tax=Streptomyces sp. AK08-02 TaxID=3028654 RepID=UPI0029A8A8E4|nr:hypothetical protein [Streptomyces sp. AK08-02]MDX3749647.1 hypothetical protein [Streptomyces sp. AK08-02]
MTDNSTPTAVAATLHHRNAAVTAFNKVQAQYEIAILDHVSARIRAAFPDTTHLTFVHYSRSRHLDLQAFFATGPDGTQRQILDATTNTPSLDLDELTDDLAEALGGLNSAAWSAVRPESPGEGQRVLDLPPYDRAARIAELARAHHPQAILLTVDFTNDPAQILDLAGADIAQFGDSLTETVQALPHRPLWPAETERQIAVLAAQIRALPHLCAQHLLPIDTPEGRRAILALPTPTQNGMS